jgi:hypothetical protein
MAGPGTGEATEAAFRGSPHPRRAVLLLAALIAVSLATAARAEAFVYWAGGEGSTTIGRANNDGSGVDKSFITGASAPRGVAVDAKHIYWANENDQSIGRANLDGSGVDQNFITGAGRPFEVAVDGTHIYWSNFATGTSDPNLGSIGRAKLDGSDVRRPLFGNQSNLVHNPCGVATGGGFLYWANSSPPILMLGPPTIGRSPIPDPLPNGSFVDDTGGDLACWPSVSGSHVYWAEFPTGILRVPIDDPNGGLDFLSNSVASGGTAIHASRLYWANAEEGTVSRSNLDGSAPDFAFIRGAGQVGGLAVNSLGPGGGDGGDGDDANDFSFGKVKKNKRKGTAKLTVNVPGAGELKLAKTKKVKADDESPEDAGKEKLAIKPKGKAKRKLNDKGRAKVNAEVTYTPDGGEPNTQSKKVKLAKK